MTLRSPRSPSLTALCNAFETLTLENLPTLMACYATDAHFKDPFNDVIGQAAIAEIFRHMFNQVDSPKFSIIDTVEQGQTALLTWNFTFCMKRWDKRTQTIHGATYFSFKENGLVIKHRDYWDAAEELYEKIPFLGGFMRVLKNNARR